MSPLDQAWRTWANTGLPQNVTEVNAILTHVS